MDDLERKPGVAGEYELDSINICLVLRTMGAPGIVVIIRLLLLLLLLLLGDDRRVLLMFMAVEDWISCC